MTWLRCLRPRPSGLCRCRGTREEVERLIREAIEFHIEGLRLHGDPVPEPTTVADTVDVAAQDAALLLGSNDSQQYFYPMRVNDALARSGLRAKFLGLGLILLGVFFVGLDNG